MRLIKVYDSKGNHVDSFNKSVTKVGWIRGDLGINTQIRILNERGFYVRRQFTKAMNLKDYVK